MSCCKDCIYLDKDKERFSMTGKTSYYCGKQGEYVSEDDECRYFSSPYNWNSGLTWYGETKLFGTVLGFSCFGGRNCCADCIHMDIKDEDWFGHFYCKKHDTYYSGGDKVCDEFKQKNLDNYS